MKVPSFSCGVNQVNKHSTRVSDGRSQFLGDLEHSVLRAFAESGLTQMSFSDIVSSVGRGKRPVWTALSRLVRRGLLAKASRGMYRITDLGVRALASMPVRRLSRIARQFSDGQADGTRVPGASPDRPLGYAGNCPSGPLLGPPSWDPSSTTPGTTQTGLTASSAGVH